MPSINHKPLDLWLLRKEVHKLGGYDAVDPHHLSFYAFPPHNTFPGLGYGKQEMVRSRPNSRLRWHSWALDSTQELIHPCHSPLRAFLPASQKLPFIVAVDTKPAAENSFQRSFDWKPFSLGLCGDHGRRDKSPLQSSDCNI